MIELDILKTYRKCGIKYALLEYNEYFLSHLNKKDQAEKEAQAMSKLEEIVENGEIYYLHKYVQDLEDRARYLENMLNI